MNQTIEVPIGIAIDIRNILRCLQDRPVWVQRIEAELSGIDGLIDNTMDWINPAVENALES